MMSIDNCLQQQKIQTKTISKSTLSAYYQVDRATLNKWLILFCNDIFSNKNNLLNRRKFSDLEIEKIKHRLGYESQAFRKVDLVRIAETDYKTIRENIRKHQMLYPITENQYRSLSKFPPKVAQQIIDALG